MKNATNRPGAALALGLLLLAGGFLRAMDQTAADAVATAALNGRTAGVCAVPRCGTGELVVSFANKSRMLVHGFDNNWGNVAAAQGKIAALGRLGRGIYVSKAPLTPMPYADNFLDVLVLDGAAGAELTAGLYAEIERVISPGCSAWVSSSGDLSGWISAATGSQGSTALSTAQVVSNSTGTWAVITRKPTIPGTFEWNHANGSPDGNRFTTDTVARWPFIPQWRQKPYTTQRYNAYLPARPNVNLSFVTDPVCAGGRMYQILDAQDGLDPSKGYYGFQNNTYFVRAMSMFNGQILWEQGIPAFAVNSPLMAGTAHLFCIGDPAGGTLIGTVRAFDGPTGAPCDMSALLAGGENVVNAPEAGGALCGVIGDTLYGIKTDGAANYLFAYNQSSPSAGSIGYKVNVGNRAGSIEWCLFVDRAYILTSSGGNSTLDRLSCYNLADGSLRWGPVAMSQPQAVAPNANSFQALGSSQGVLVGNRNGSSMTLYSAVDGHQIWTNPGAVGVPAMLNDSLGIIVGAKNQNPNGDNSSGKWSLATGQKTGSLGAAGGCATAVSATPQAFFSQYGLNSFFDTQKSFPALWSCVPRRLDCTESALISDGMKIHQGMKGCSCVMNIRGNVIDGPMGTFNAEQAAVQADRLDQGPAYGITPALAMSGSLDWLAYRANNNHSGSVSATVPSPANLGLLWQYANPVPFVTPPAIDNYRTDHKATTLVTANGFTFMAGSDGIVKCLDNATGQLVWSFATGAEIFASPALDSGYVYVGSGDGYAYCLDAATGGLVWRFRAAPAERRMNHYGKLMSTWPILTGVLVNSGTAYFASGSVDYFGAHVFAVNSQTGQLVWQNTTAGTFIDAASRVGLSPSGYMAIVGSNLWVRSWNYYDGFFDLATGAAQATPATSNTGRPYTGSCDIGVLGSYILRGGKTFFHENNDCNKGGYSFTKLSGATPQYPRVSFQAPAGNGSPWEPCIMPAWDSSSIFMVTAGNTLCKFTLSGTNGYYAYLDAAVAANAGGKPPEATFITGNTATSDWSLGVGSWNGAMDVVAAGNIVAEVQPVNAWYGLMYWDTYDWRLRVFDKSSGALLWTSPQLPGEPLYQGLAVDRNGNILVALVNGDVLCYGVNANQVVAPVFSPTTPPAGAGFPNTMVGNTPITIATTTPGATIYYTTDGSAPTTSSAHGTAGSSTASLSANASFMLKAMAAKSGMQASATTSVSYAFQTAAPVISPSGGVFAGPTQVTLSAGAGAAIYYTIDGSSPNRNGILYTGPFTLPLGVFTVAASVKQSGLLDSTATSAQFSIGVPTKPVISLSGTGWTGSGGSYSSFYPVTATITSSPGAAIWYTLDGSIPSPTSASSQLYTGPLTLSKFGLNSILAIAVASGIKTTYAQAMIYIGQVGLVMSSSGGGTTSPPPGTNTVCPLVNQTITATPNSGYHFKKWVVTAGSPYDFNMYGANGASWTKTTSLDNPSTINLTGSNSVTVTAYFEPDTQCTVATSITGGGTISPAPDANGEIVFTAGTSPKVNFSPASYVLGTTLTVDGNDATDSISSNSYSFANIQGTHTLSVIFLSNYNSGWNEHTYGYTSAPIGVGTSPFVFNPPTTYTADNLYPPTVYVPEGGSTTFTVCLRAQPPANAVVSVAPSNTSPNIFASPSTLTFTTSNWSAPQTVTLTAPDDHAIKSRISYFALTSPVINPMDPNDWNYQYTNFMYRDYVVARTVESDFSFTVNSGGNGTTSPSGQLVLGKNDLPLSISATPSTNYTFKNWTVTSGAATFANYASPSTTVGATAGPVVIQANFVREIPKQLDLWMKAYGLAGSDALATANPAGDGIKNLIKYALGIDPSQPSQAAFDPGHPDVPGMPSVSCDGVNLYFNYQRDIAKTDISYTVETSTDLVHWSNAGVSEQVLSSNGTVQTVQASAARSGPKCFIRLRVTTQ